MMLKKKNRFRISSYWFNLRMETNSLSSK